MTPEERAAEISDLTEFADNARQGARLNVLIAAAIREAVAEEREACARVAEDLSAADPTDSRYHGAREASERIAAAIRARA